MSLYPDSLLPCKCNAMSLFLRRTGTKCANGRTPGEIAFEAKAKGLKSGKLTLSVLK